MSPFTKLFLVAMFAAGILASQGALAHAYLSSATPAQNAALAASPRQVILRFNEKLETGFSGITLLDSGGKQVDTRKATVDKADPRMMTLALPLLAPGKYTVHYVAVGSDGHRRTGSYSFTLK